MSDRCNGVGLARHELRGTDVVAISVVCSRCAAQTRLPIVPLRDRDPLYLFRLLTRIERIAVARHDATFHEHQPITCATL